MRLKATRAGTFPAGCHWAPGKEREVKVPKGVEIPAWLVEVKPKPKAKASKAKASAEPSDSEG